MIYNIIVSYKNNKGRFFKMDRQYFTNLLKFYENELDDTLNFWYNHGYDKENGGFYTCLERNGNVYDTDKAVWAQGRGLWVFAKAYNFIKQDPRYLEAAKHAYEFITTKCYDSDKRMYFTVTGDGQLVQKRRYWFSESFSVVGSAELYRATKDEKHLLNARETFETLLKVKRGDYNLAPKFNPETVNCIALASPMILLITSQILREIDVERTDYYNGIIDASIEEIKLHYHPEIKAVLEKEGYEVFFISNILHDNVDALMRRTYEVLKDAPSFPLYEDKGELVKTYNALEDAKREFEIVRTGSHSYQIRGERIERTYSLINLTTDEGVSKLLSILRNLGVDEVLHEMGLENGDIVSLCDFEFEYYE